MHNEENRDDERNALETPGEFSRDDCIDEQFPQQAALLRLRSIADTLWVTLPTLLAELSGDGTDTDNEAATTNTPAAKALFDHCRSIEDPRIRHVLAELVHGIHCNVEGTVIRNRRSRI